MEKSRYWTAVCYPENMVDDWEVICGDIIGYPCCYCIHDKDHLSEYQLKKDEEDKRKVHVHFLIAYGNTTTSKSVLNLVNRLSKSGSHCCPFVQSVSSVRNLYEYLIHNTETAKKQKKYLYPVSDRHCLNNFDIGAFEQVSNAEKLSMAKKLADLIIEYKFTNFMDFYCFVVSNYDTCYFEILKTNSGFYERLIKGVFLKISDDKKYDKILELKKIVENDKKKVAD